MELREPVRKMACNVRGAWRWSATSLLASVGEASRDRLLDCGTMREYPADRRLITQGDTSTFVVVLLDGVVKVTSVSSGGREALISVRVGGDLLGELAAIDSGPRSCTATACGLVMGCVIMQADFLAVLARDRSLAAAVTRSMVAKLRAGTERQMDFAVFDAPTRFARVLRELADTYGERSGNRVTMSWPVTQSELASLASVAEPTAQKALRQLRQAGVLSTGYRSLTIEDFSALNQIAGD
ncbi:MAG TPA: Crp/Fnr family transcriptional regulator [Streptosporangiaceae bacterium]|jgi:CRP/FNR family transcriptional regulator, cyclic AMP receptor protein|nr:Crp/Fnr family transcriptional regulator [Streptosporangiaceae bacterium]